LQRIISLNSRSYENVAEETTANREIFQASID
jgi:hypothetical protein